MLSLITEKQPKTQTQNECVTSMGGGEKNLKQQPVSHFQGLGDGGGAGKKEKGKNTYYVPIMLDREREQDTPYGIMRQG